MFIDNSFTFINLDDYEIDYNEFNINIITEELE